MLKKIKEVERAPLGGGVYDTPIVRMTRDGVGMLRHGVMLLAGADQVGRDGGSSAIDREPHHG